MKDEIKAKIKSIIDYILAKDVKDITYNEYKLLNEILKEEDNYE